MVKFPRKIAKISVGIADAILIAMTYKLALHIRFGELVLSENIRPIISNLPYILIGYIGLYYVYGLYSVLRKTLYEQLISIFIINSIMTITSMAVVFFQRDFGFPRSIFLLSFLIQTVLLMLFRTLVYVVRKWLHGQQKVLIIGSEQEVDQLARQIVLTQKWYVIKAIVLIDENFGWGNVGVDLEDVKAIFVGESLSGKNFDMLLAEGKSVYKVPSITEVHMNNSVFQKCGDVPLYYLTPFEVSDETLIAKRIFDFICAIIALIALSPVFLAAGVAIKLDSKGPIFYKQERMTFKEKKFMVYKFRSMAVDAENRTGPVLAKENDDRITQVGSVLRKTRIDELPQLINVLMGDMSMVGPRPEREFFINEITKDLPEFRYRMTVRAGITGLAQVYGRYTTSNKDKLIYDFMYIRSCSIATDIKIILNTLKVVFQKSAAEGWSSCESLVDFLKKHSYKVEISGGLWCLELKGKKQKFFY